MNLEALKIGICICNLVTAIQVEISQFHSVFLNGRNLTSRNIAGSNLLEVGKNCKKKADCKVICKKYESFVFSSEITYVPMDCGDISDEGLGLLHCWTSIKGKIFDSKS